MGLRAMFGSVRTVALILAACVTLPAICSPQENAPKPGEPSGARARKSFEEAQQLQRQHAFPAAIDSYRKADKQDGGRCRLCLQRAYNLATDFGDFKSAEDTGRTMLSEARSDAERAQAHFYLALALQRQGIGNHKEKCFAESCAELEGALHAHSEFAMAHYAMGVSLAYLHKDEEARREFTEFLKEQQPPADLSDRARRYLENIDLARALMAPPFSLVTLDGQHITMDGLAGKVVLIDFWATFCGPCIEALPHIRKIARQFAGQPFVMLSVSLDVDDARWREFVAGNGMTWMQYRDGTSGVRMANRFSVRAIPATFTIDADGVLENQSIGDADIESKIKKLVARAVDLNRRKTAEAAAIKAESGTN